jgi:hypothetical protein
MPDTPLDRVIRIFGNQNQIAEILGCNRASITLWRTRLKGKIPPKDWEKLVKAAHARGKKLRYEDLV